MGEDRQDATGPPPTERVSVPQAADHLGTTVDALRKRVQRKTIPHERDRDGRVWILLDTGRPRQDAVQDTGQGPSQSDSDALISEMQDRIDSLEHQLSEANERDRENRRIIVALTSRISELEASQEQPGASETVSEAPEEAEPRVAAASAPATRIGMSAPVLVLSFVATLLSWSVAGWLGYSETNVDRLIPDNLIIATTLAIPLLFGLWAGGTKRPSLRWFSSPHRWLRRGGRSVLEFSFFAAGVPGFVGANIGALFGMGQRGFFGQLFANPLGYLVVVVIIFSTVASQAFLSGALLSNALRRLGVMGTPRAREQEEVWTPRQEARLGFIGTLLTVIASIIVAFISRGA